MMLNKRRHEIPKITCTFSNIDRSKTRKKIPDKKHLMKWKTQLRILELKLTVHIRLMLIRLAFQA